ncbi:MAG: BBP7 family outer membrane beta-barrel protein [Planctomycetota bacterium]
MLKRIGPTAVAATLVGVLSAFAASAVGAASAGEPEATPLRLPAVSAEAMLPGGSTAYPAGDFYRQLTAATGDAPDSCPYHWGKGGSPFRTGPGLCDDFRVGRRWRTQYEGLVLFRDTTNLDALIAAATAGGVAIPNDPTTLNSNFDHGGGAKLSLISGWPQCKGYELQVAYEGVFEWNAGAFNPDVPPAGPIAPDTPVTQRSLTYRSSLHSLEVNGLRGSNRVFQPFAGIRYIRLADNLDDFADQTAPIPIPPVAGLTVTDVLRTTETKNNLIGFQVGARSELQPTGGRFSFAWYGNAGAYCNLLTRASQLQQTDSFITVDDPMTPDVNEGTIVTSTATSRYKSDAERMAFVGELGLSGVYQVNRCLKLRLGYQVLVLDGIELGDALFLGNGNSSDTQHYHGWFAGIERRR